MSNLVDDIYSPWGHLARTQGLVFAPTGDIIDDGAGHITLPSILVISPATGSYFTVNAGSFTLGSNDAIVFDVPPTSTERAAVDARALVWADGDRLYDNRDTFILGIRVGTGRFALVQGGVPGTRTVRVPVDLRNPQLAANAGNVFPNVAALTAWEKWHWEFVKDVDGWAYGILMVPSNLAPTPNVKFILELSANAVAGATVMAVSTRKAADGESLNPATFAQTTSQTITVPATARLRKSVVYPASGAWGETFTAGDLVLVGLRHDGANAADTLAVNTEVQGLWMECKVL